MDYRYYWQKEKAITDGCYIILTNGQLSLVTDIITYHDIPPENSQQIEAVQAVLGRWECGCNQPQWFKSYPTTKINIVPEGPYDFQRVLDSCLSTEIKPINPNIECYKDKPNINDVYVSTSNFNTATGPTRQELENITGYALIGNIEPVRNALTKYADTIKFENLHNNIARIAISQRNKELFKITNHQPRLLLEEFASNYNKVKFMVEIYQENGYWARFTIPSYVWRAASPKVKGYLMASGCCSINK